MSPSSICTDPGKPQGTTTIKHMPGLLPLNPVRMQKALESQSQEEAQPLVPMQEEPNPGGKMLCWTQHYSLSQEAEPSSNAAYRWAKSFPFSRSQGPHVPQRRMD